MVAMAVQQVIPSLTGLAEDRVILDWSFTTTDNTEATTDLVVAALIDFWADTSADVGFGTPTFPPCEMLSDDVRDDTWQFRFYSVNAATEEKTFVRLYDNSFTLAGSEPMPEEVSIRLTAHGTLDGGETDRRRRGGWFLGGGIAMALSEVVDFRTRPVAGVFVTLQSAARNLVDASDAAADWTWDIRSTTYHQSVPVVGGWIDNAWDTIRSRGPGATARHSWAATP